MRSANAASPSQAQLRPAHTNPDARSRRPYSRFWWVLAFCSVALVFAVYYRSLDFQFILDDHRFTGDPRIQDSGHLWDYFFNYVWAQFTGGPASFYRPIFLVWVRANYAVSALSPWGWHFLSIAKHLAVAALLGLLVWRLVRDPLISLVVATLFALHPAQTESVSWVTVPDPLISAGILASLLFYLQYLNALSASAPESEAKKPEAKKRRRKPGPTAGQAPAKWIIASAAAYFLALLTKETAIVFPILIAAVGFSQPSSQANKSEATDSVHSRINRALRQVFPFLCATAIYLLLRFQALAGHLSASTQHLPWSALLLSAPATLWFYVKVMFWPVHSYSFADPTISEKLSLRGVVLPFLGVTALLAALLIVIFFAWKRTAHLTQDQGQRLRIGLLCGALLLILPLLLTLNLNALNPGDFLHGRYTYLPLCGLMLILAVGWTLLPNLRVFLSCAAVALIVAFAVLTHSQEAQWKDDATVFTVAHQLAPHNAPVAQNLAHTRLQAALELDEQGRCSEAIPVFDQITRDYPEDWYAWAGVGDCFVQLNNLPKAEEALHRAADLSHDPRVIQQWQELRAHMGLPSSAK